MSGEHSKKGTWLADKKTAKPTLSFFKDSDFLDFLIKKGLTNNRQDSSINKTIFYETLFHKIVKSNYL